MFCSASSDDQAKKDSNNTIPRCALNKPKRETEAEQRQLS